MQRKQRLRQAVFDSLRKDGPEKSIERHLASPLQTKINKDFHPHTLSTSQQQMHLLMQLFWISYFTVSRQTKCTCRLRTNNINYTDAASVVFTKSAKCYVFFQTVYNIGSPVTSVQHWTILPRVLLTMLFLHGS